VLLLTDLPPESAMLGAVERRAQRVHRPTVAPVSDRLAVVRLPGTGDEYLRSLTSHRRTRIRYARRRLASAHGGRFFVWSDPTELDAAFERLAELHHLRWQASG